jgi:hypothetical protein
MTTTLDEPTSDDPYEGWSDFDFRMEEENRQYERWKEASLWREEREPWTP